MEQWLRVFCQGYTEETNGSDWHCVLKTIESVVSGYKVCPLTIFHCGFVEYLYAQNTFSETEHLVICVCLMKKVRDPKYSINYICRFGLLKTATSHL